MIEVVLYVLGIVIVVVGLAFSIALHEVGHLIPAKLFGVKVTQYMIGFGKTIRSWRFGETEYGVKLLPFGGYIAMIGMYPPQKPGKRPRSSTTGFLNTVMQEGTAVVSQDQAAVDDPGAVSALQQKQNVEPVPRRGLSGMVDEARLASSETIDQGEDHRTFYRLPVWKKIVVMLGGPLMNLLLAFVFFGIVLTGFGIPQNSTTLGRVSECLLPVTSERTSCVPEDPQAPAAEAGLKPGDRIVSVDGERVESWDHFRSLIAQSPHQTLRVQFVRHGAHQQVMLTPVPNERAMVQSDGTVRSDGDGGVLTETVGMIGATPAVETVRQPVTELPVFVGDNVSRVVGVVTSFPQRMVDIWNAAFSAQERDPNGPISVVGVGRIAGEVVSLDAPVAAKAQTMIGMLGSVNVALFVFNLVPLMPLDGGHIVGAVYEGLKRGVARLLRKPRPQPVDTAKMVPVTFAVTVLLGVMFVLLVYVDIVKPVSLFG